MTLIPIVILAGGFATRMQPYTTYCPKSLLLCQGKPFLHHQLEQLQRFGAHRIYLCLGHLATTITDYLAQHPYPQLQITCINQGPDPQGTADAIRCGLAQLPEQFFVINGDTYPLQPLLPIQDHFQQQRKPALMTTYDNRYGSDHSNIIISNGRITRYAKASDTRSMMTHIDYGIGMYHQSVFVIYPHSDLGEVNQALIATEQLSHFETDRSYYEIGSMEGLRRFNAYLQEQPNSRRHRGMNTGLLIEQTRNKVKLLHD